MNDSPLSLDQQKRLATTLRLLAADAVQRANSGHPGMPMGMADVAASMWSSFLRFCPSDPGWAGRDRFVLSAGHGSMLLYGLLHLFGYELSLEEIKNFRQWKSLTPGHPEYELTPGVETTTGPLGQGFANGVGIALSGKLQAERYSSDLFGYRVFGIVSDGDLMEGVTSEAASLAGHLALGNLIYVYDDNQISIGGSTSVCFTEDVAKRFESYNWHVQSIDGHDLSEISTALRQAEAESDRPSLICARTQIAFGSPNLVGTSDSHGAPLGEEEIRLTKEALGWPEKEEFLIPDDVKQACATVAELGQQEYQKWHGQLKSWKSANGDLAAKFEAQQARSVPAALKSELLAELGKGDKEATRATSGRAIQIIAKHLPYFIGGSADLEPSNKTLIKDAEDINTGAYSGRNIRFGVREHAMGSLVNGLAYGRDWIPYSATFLVFSDYMRPAMRLAALSHLQALFIFTHDSFWVGEDGPTHQPIEHAESLRLIPGLHVHRPADGLETALSYLAAVERKDGPSTLLFTRQSVPPIQRDSVVTNDEILQGGYVVSGRDIEENVIVASGSEVWLACDAAKILAERGQRYRVVSVPCREKFLLQDREYRESVIPSSAVRKVSIEAGVTSGWRALLGPESLNIGIDHFGASAPGAELAEQFGFTPEKAVDRIVESFS